jgi:CubicO group peptidase (beta-lactamase class C family)
MQIVLDLALDAVLADNRLVGGAVMVKRGGERRYERAAGLADREAGVPLRTDTIVR